MRTVIFRCALTALALSSCDKNRDHQPEDSGGSSSASSSSSTGAEPCELTIEAEEALDADPNGCYPIQDEQACLSKPEECTALYGTPATYSCDSAAWCVADPNVSTFLGCHPFTICKRSSKTVCKATDDGVAAFWTVTCIPTGYGECQPGFANEDPMDPPGTCE